MTTKQSCTSPSYLLCSFQTNTCTPNCWCHCGPLHFDKGHWRHFLLVYLITESLITPLLPKIGFIKQRSWWCCFQWNGRALQLSYFTNICLFFNLPRDFLQAMAQSKPFDICQDCQMAWACVCEHVALNCVHLCVHHPDACTQ